MDPMHFPRVLLILLVTFAHMDWVVTEHAHSLNGVAGSADRLRHVEIFLLVVETVLALNGYRMLTTKTCAQRHAAGRKEHKLLCVADAWFRKEQV
jgi:hypothetical protein